MTPRKVSNTFRSTQGSRFHALLSRSHAPRRRPSRAALQRPEVLTGSGAILRSLELLGVKDVFGLPGGAIMPFYDELMSSTAIRHILVRHEQGAGHAAEGYASSTGKLGVVHRHLRPRRDQPGHRDRRRAHGLGAAAGDHRSGVLHLDGHRRVPGGRHRRHLDADHQALVPRDEARGRAGHDRRGRTTSPPPAARARAGGCHQGRAAEQRTVHLAAQARPARLPAGDQGARQADPGRGTSCSPRRNGRCFYVGGGVIRAEASAELLALAETDRRPGGDHAHGPRRVPRLAPAAPRDARHARRRSRGARPAGDRTCSSPSAPGSTTGSRARRTCSRPTPRSFTSTSTRPRSRRSASPMCRSLAMPKMSSPT